MTLLESLAKLDELDFRVKGRCRYTASEIALVTLCSLVSGGTSYYDFANYGVEKAGFLKGLGAHGAGLPKFVNGTPSHDAIRYFKTGKVILMRQPWRRRFLTWPPVYVRINIYNMYMWGTEMAADFRVAGGIFAVDVPVSSFNGLESPPMAF